MEEANQPSNPIGMGNEDVKRRKKRRHTCPSASAGGRGALLETHCALITYKAPEQISIFQYFRLTLA